MQYCSVTCSVRGSPQWVGGFAGPAKARNACDFAHSERSDRHIHNARYNIAVLLYWHAVRETFPLTFNCQPKTPKGQCNCASVQQHIAHAESLLLPLRCTQMRMHEAVVRCGLQRPGSRPPQLCTWLCTSLHPCPLHSVPVDQAPPAFQRAPVMELATVLLRDRRVLLVVSHVHSPTVRARGPGAGVTPSGRPRRNHGFSVRKPRRGTLNSFNTDILNAVH